ncbi:MAG: class I tRNA ligase family protein [Gemmatimonadales bacterium]
MALSFEHQDEFRRHFPADFICEGVDQTRGWFYSLLAIGATVFDQAPYRNVVVNELVLDADGQKMSKSRGNVVDPWEALTEGFGADTVRLYLLAASQVWLPRPFDRTDSRGGGQVPQRCGTPTSFWLATRAPARRGRVGSPDLARPVDPEPSRGDRRTSDGGLGRLRRHDRCPRHHDLSDGQTSPTGTSGFQAHLGARSGARRGRSSPHPASLPGDGRANARARGCAADWIHRALAGSGVHLADFSDHQLGRPGAGARPGDGCRAAARPIARPERPRRGRAQSPADAGGDAGGRARRHRRQSASRRCSTWWLGKSASGGSR